MRFSSETPTGVSAVTSIKTLVGEDSPEAGTSAILLMDLVRLGVAGSNRCRRGLSNLLLMLVSVAMIIMLWLWSCEYELFVNDFWSKSFC